MILYFSSTGNCRYAADRIAEKFSDTAVSILETNSVHIKKGEMLGFVFPTYFWRLPSIVDEYMNNLSITSDEENPYIWFIATYGGTCGQTGTFMKKHLKKKGYSLSLSFGIKTVDDWTVWYDATNKEEISSVLSSEQEQMQTAIEYIADRTTGNRMKNKLSMIAVCGSGIFYDRARRTKHLHVNGNCIGCGLCEKECPTKSIVIKDGKPAWVNEKCTMCLHCIHSCPKFAIQYDDKTEKNGQYHHP